MIDPWERHRQKKPGQLFCLLFVLPAVAALAGCGGAGNKVAMVTGTVTLNGKPLADAMVEFVPIGGTGSTAFGRTDDNGAYKMEYSRDQSGVFVGKYEVHITTADVYVDENEKQIRVPEKVPARYNSDTELTCEVKPGSNTLDFDLEGTRKVAKKRKEAPSDDDIELGDDG